MNASNQATINMENASASFSKQQEASESYDSLGPIKGIFIEVFKIQFSMINLNLKKKYPRKERFR